MFISNWIISLVCRRVCTIIITCAAQKVKLRNFLKKWFTAASPWLGNLLKLKLIILHAHSKRRTFFACHFLKKFFFLWLYATLNVYMDRVLSFFFLGGGGASVRKISCAQSLKRRTRNRDVTCWDLLPDEIWRVDVNSIQMYSFNQETSGAESKAWEADRNIFFLKKRCERIKRVSYYYILGPPHGNNI